ncbi:MAG TPA: PRC-barrel domain-containing protein [Polyangiaceae bacterium]|nr:PRC-barrel domain-containing protein [Polyangiaceae bacterium]
MLRSASRLLGYRLNAMDGQIGRCVDFLIDERSWVVRYVVIEAVAVEASRRLAGRRVLISPLALRKADWDARRWVLEGTRRQVESAPLVDEEGPPSRSQELELWRHYGWDIAGFSSILSETDNAPGVESLAQQETESTLGSLKQLFGYGLDAEDANVGHVQDVLLDDDNWTCRQLMVSGRSWLSGHGKLVPTDWVSRIDSKQHRILVPLPSARIESEPEYDAAAPSDRLPHTVATAGAPERAAPAGRGGRPWAFSAPQPWLRALGWGTRGLRAAWLRALRPLGDRHLRI